MEVMQDPAADLSKEDSALWLELFAMLKKNGELTAKLLYLRGVGCRLVEHGRSYKIMPIIDPSGMEGWTSQEQYDREKWVLMAHKDELSRALGLMHSFKEVC